MTSVTGEAATGGAGTAMGAGAASTGGAGGGVAGGGGTDASGRAAAIKPASGDSPNPAASAASICAGLPLRTPTGSSRCALSTPVSAAKSTAASASASAARSSTTGSWANISGVSPKRRCSSVASVPRSAWRRINTSTVSDALFRSNREEALVLAAAAMAGEASSEGMTKGAAREFNEPAWRGRPCADEQRSPNLLAHRLGRSAGDARRQPGVLRQQPPFNDPLRCHRRGLHAHRRRVLAASALVAAVGGRLVARDQVVL